jgi:hypothetical protein
MGMKLGIVGLIGILLLTGCGQRDEELELSCDKMSSNMFAFESKIEDIDKIYNERINRFESLGANWESASRRDLIENVSKQFPFLAQHLNEEIYARFGKIGGSRDYMYSSETFLKYVSLLEVLKDTGFKLEISDSQADLLKSEPTWEGVKLINSEIERIWGAEGCDRGGKETLFFADKVSRGTQWDFWGLFISLKDIVNCETTGRTTEYMAIGDGTPGKYEVVKCRA